MSEFIAQRRDQVLGFVIMFAVLALLVAGSLLGDAPNAITEWPIS